ARPARVTGPGRPADPRARAGSWTLAGSERVKNLPPPPPAYIYWSGRNRQGLVALTLLGPCVRVRGISENTVSSDPVGSIGSSFFLPAVARPIHRAIDKRPTASSGGRLSVERGSTIHPEPTGSFREVSMWEKRDASGRPSESPVNPVYTSDPSKGGRIVNIGPSIFIKGELQGDEDLTIDGRVAGKIALRDPNSTIGPNGKTRRA